MPQSGARRANYSFGFAPPCSNRLMRYAEDVVGV